MLIYITINSCMHVLQEIMKLHIHCNVTLSELTYIYACFTCSSDTILDCTQLKPVKHLWAMVGRHESWPLIKINMSPIIWNASPAAWPNNQTHFQSLSAFDAAYGVKLLNVGDWTVPSSANDSKADLVSIHIYNMHVQNILLAMHVGYWHNTSADSYSKCMTVCICDR